MMPMPSVPTPNGPTHVNVIQVTQATVLLAMMSMNVYYGTAAMLMVSALTLQGHILAHVTTDILGMVPPVPTKMSVPLEQMTVTSMQVVPIQLGLTTAFAMKVI